MKDYIMDRKSLKRHCEATCERFKKVPTSSTYGEHRLVLDLLEQTEWIPVSENPPEENGWYQCTVIINALPCIMELFYKNGKWLDNRRIDMFNVYDIYGYGCTKEKHKLSYQELISEFDWTENVTAWMPLPEPYNVESEGKK